MDNLTHTLTGVALSQAGLNRKTRFAALALILGSNAPDVDIVARLGGTTRYLEYHRGITHSLAGLALLAVILSALIYFPGRRARPKPALPPLRAGWLFILCVIALLGHLLLDFTNAYGVRPFLPFSGHWFAWDIMPIFDPLLLLVLIAGLGLPALLRLVSEEVGARKTGYRRGAICALAGMLLLWGLRDVSHRRALSLLGSNNYGQETPRRLGAFPVAVNPFTWTGVVETDSAFYVTDVSALDSSLDADQAHVFHKPEPSAALNAALQTHLGHVFLNFARFPWAEVQAFPVSGSNTAGGNNLDGYEVKIRDLRFASAATPLSGSFTAKIDLDPDLRPISQTFSFMGEPSTEQ